MSNERNRLYKSACDAFGNPFIDPSAEAAIVRHAAFRSRPQAPSAETPATEPNPGESIEATGAERTIVELTPGAAVRKVE